MTTRPFALALLCLASTLATSACHQAVYSPPSRLAPLATTDALATGETKIHASGAGQGAVFGATATSATVRVEHGFGDELSGDASATMHYVSNDGASQSHRNVYSGRVGVVWVPEAVEWIGLSGGVGGGGSAGGGFLSPDAGLMVSYPNRYIVPWANFSAFFSVPLGAEAVDITGEIGQEDPYVAVFDTPKFTGGMISAMGFYLPIPVATGRLGLHGAMMITNLTDEDDNTSLLGLSGGLDVAF